MSKGVRRGGLEGKTVAAIGISVLDAGSAVARCPDPGVLCTLGAERFRCAQLCC